MVWTFFLCLYFLYITFKIIFNLLSFFFSVLFFPVFLSGGDGGTHVTGTKTIGVRTPQADQTEVSTVCGVCRGCLFIIVKSVMTPSLSLHYILHFCSLPTHSLTSYIGASFPSSLWTMSSELHPTTWTPFLNSPLWWILLFLGFCDSVISLLPQHFLAPSRAPFNCSFWLSTL